MKYEYEYLSFGAELNHEDDVKLINREGALGWELTQVSFQQRLAVFKRKIVEPSPVRRFFSVILNRIRS